MNNDIEDMFRTKSFEEIRQEYVAHSKKQAKELKLNYIPKITVEQYQDLIRDRDDTKFNYLWVDIYGNLHCDEITKTRKYGYYQKLPEFKRKVHSYHPFNNYVGIDSANDIEGCVYWCNDVNVELRRIFDEN